MSIPLVPLLLVLASSLAWAGCDLSRKLLVKEIPPVALLFLLTLGTAPIFVVWVVVEGGSWPGAGYWGPALGSVALNVAANLLLLQGMRIAPLSVTVPLLSLTPAFATLLAIPMLGERPSGRGWLGILMVIAGAVWLHWQPRGGAAHPADTGALKGALMVASTALCWSMTTPLDKMALRWSTAPFHGFVSNAGVAVAVLGVLLARGWLADVGRVRAVPGVLVAALFVNAIALGLQFLALPHVYVGAMETLKRGIGNFMALLSGRVFFGEAVTPGKLLAVIVMAVGVGLILT